MGSHLDVELSCSPHLSFSYRITSILAMKIAKQIKMAININQWFGRVGSRNPPPMSRRRHCHVRFPLGYYLSFKPPGGTTRALFCPFRPSVGQYHFHRLGLAGPGNFSTIILLVLAVLVVKMDDGSSTLNRTQSILRSALTLTFRGEAASTAPPHVRALLDAWFSFHIIGGHFLVPVLITTFLFSKAKRDATLINFGITIILSSITNCLLSVIPCV
jgi:hypothetical protein